jgi:hypothetical protein
MVASKYRIDPSLKRRRWTWARRSSIDPDRDKLHREANHYQREPNARTDSVLSLELASDCGIRISDRPTDRKECRLFEIWLRRPIFEDDGSARDAKRQANRIEHLITSHACVSLRPLWHHRAIQTSSIATALVSLTEHS